MKKISLLLLLLSYIGFAQESNIQYDEKLAKTLNADEYGMKTYVFCLLKTGSNTTASKSKQGRSGQTNLTTI